MKSGKGCADCRCFQYEAAYYMVYDRVWEEAGAHPKSKLCLGCLSKRLGRKLQRSDFNSAPTNKQIFDVLDNVK